LANYPLIPGRLQQIDQLTAQEHHYIDLSDECYYLWERVSDARYDQYAVNDFIKNLQIAPNCSNAARRLPYKTAAIGYGATALSGLIPGDRRQSSTFVPIPPSQVRGDPGHDDRLLRLLRSTMPPLADIRELVLQIENTVSKEKQIPPDERARNYRINEECANPDPNEIWIFDDVLAGGSHFKGVTITLRQRYPGARIVGLFLTRAVRPNVTPTPDDEITIIL
jgi:hypothetical protein